MATPVTIPDTAFKNYLLSCLPGATELTEENLSTLASLYYSGEGLPENEKISDLEGIQYCTNVTSVQFPYNNLTSLPNLEALTQLIALVLINNQISDLSNFSLLPTSLTQIQLFTNQITTLPTEASFARLNQLEILYLNDNQISDITSLSGLPNTISQLWLSQNLITDLSALANLTGLTFLELYNNSGITDLSPLKDLTNLNLLYIAGTQVTTVTSLKKLINLKELWLHDNQITSIAGLEDMTELTLLTLTNNHISDISVLANKSKLTSLSINNNEISDISALAGKPQLESLLLNNNHVCDLSPLKDSPLENNFSATNQTVHLPNIILHTHRLILPYPVKDQHGNSVPPCPQQWTYYNEIPDTISWDNCYGWGNRAFDFESEDGNFSGQIHLFYQTFIPLNRHYTYYRH